MLQSCRASCGPDRPMIRHPNYDKFPCVVVPGEDHAATVGWEAIAERLRQAVAARNQGKTVLTVECYTGVDEDLIIEELRDRLSPVLALDSRQSMLSPKDIDALVAPFLGGNDPVFGFLSDLTLSEFFNQAQVRQTQQKIKAVQRGLVLLVGCGAHLLGE